MESFAAIPPLVAAVASLVLAVVVHRRAPDRALGRTFGFMALTLVFWNLNFFVLYSGMSYDVTLFTTWVLRTGAVFLLPAILHLTMRLPGRPVPLPSRVILAASYLLACALALLNMRGMLVEQLASFEWGYYSVNTRYYDFFTAFVAATFAAATAILSREYITTEHPRMRLQLKLWLFGLAIALPLGLTNLLPSYGVRFYPLGNLGSAIWAGFVGYAVVRHRLMDIEVVVTRGLSFVLVAAVLIAPLSIAATTAQGIVFGGAHYDFSALLVVLLVAAGVLFSPLQHAVERRIEATLFPAKIESRHKLQALAGEVVRILDRERLLDVLQSNLVSAFELTQFALYLRDDVGRAFGIERSVGVSPAELAQGSSVMQWLTRVAEPVLREEAEAPDVFSRYPDVADFLAANQWEACVPFMGGEELLGFACFGPRRGLQAYTAGDLKLLAQVAAEAAVALQNARLYAEVRRSRAIITRAGRLSAIGTLAAGIAHEIRNPLVSIQTFFQLAPQRLGDEEFMTSFLGIAEKEVQRISNLISELLTFARSPSSAVGVVCVNEVVVRAVKLLEPQARAEGVRLVHELASSAPRVLIDFDQLLQVVVNLLLNAVQASRSGEKVSVTTRQRQDGHDLYVQIEVRDYGTGMTAGIQESIFDPFYTTKDRGSGLGLSISHQLIVEAGGFISVESVEGRGSVFTVHLPAAQSADVSYAVK